MVRLIPKDEKLLSSCFVDDGENLLLARPASSRT